MSDEEVKAKEIADLRVEMAILKEWRCGLEKLLDERDERLGDALKLQRLENDRRLEELNGKAVQDEKDRENALLQIKEMEGKFVAKLHLEDIMKPIFSKMFEFQSWKDSLVVEHTSLTSHVKELQKSVEEVRDYKLMSVGRQSLLIIGLSSVSAIFVALIVMHFGVK